MEMMMVDKPVSISYVDKLAKQQFGELIKATVDVEKDIMMLGGDLHADEEKQLLEQGSVQKNLWGINLYPAKFGTPEFVEFDSMINIRPSQGNMSRSVEDSNTRKQIVEVVENLVKKDASA
jgi:uncharacterized protein DUF5674